MLSTWLSRIGEVEDVEEVIGGGGDCGDGSTGARGRKGDIDARGKVTSRGRQWGTVVGGGQ